MLKLHVIQAQFGDSLLLEYGTNQSKFILIDGGPKGVYDQSLRRELERIIRTNGILEALIISHIDIDHIQGTLDLLAEIQSDRDNNRPEFLNVKKVWLNTFSDIIDNSGDFTRRMNDIYSFAGAQSVSDTAAGIAVQGVKEGDKITRYCNLLGIKMNGDARNGFFIADPAQPNVAFENIEFIITGPTRVNLNELKKEWEKWLEKQEDAMANGKFDVLAMTDKSVPNLSSLTFLVKDDKKSILFTGDGRGDHLIEGLRIKGLLNQGRLHVDVLKVAHHGSDHNTNRDFFDCITADTYVISANGKYDNPDYVTLTWIVDAAKAAGRQIEIVVTNETPSTDKLQQHYPPATSGYTIRTIESGAFSAEV